MGRNKEMLSVEEIKKFIDDDKNSRKKLFAKKSQDYYEGEHEIRHYRLFY